MDSRYSKTEVGIRVKEFRTSLHMTQKEFAGSLNWDVNTYRKIETGVSLLTTDKAQNLHERYEIDINYILTGERPDPDAVLKNVWITANREERKRMVTHLMAYLHRLM